MNDQLAVEEYRIADEIGRLRSLSKEDLIRELISLKYDDSKRANDYRQHTNE